MDDGRIIEMFLERDENAVRIVSLKYGAYCGCVSRNILGNNESSEECVNDTWLKAWNSIPPQKPVNLRAFLGRITRNLSLNILRDMSREKRGSGKALLVLDELEGCIPDTHTPEKTVEYKEITESINRFLGDLSEEHRVVFLRRYWFFDDAADIASRMGWSLSKTNSLLHRLRVKLKKHLESEDITI